MASNFFQPSKKQKNEDKLYRDLRDEPLRKDDKMKIEMLWKEYEPLAPKNFLKRVQTDFHQYWWEMYLTVGLLHLSNVSGFKVGTSKQNQGPDAKITYVDGECIWIEAVAPKKGDKEKYVFSWTKIPGTDDKRLKEFLGKKYHIDWVYAAGIAKSEDGKTISIFKEDTALSLTLNNEDSEVILKIDNIETDKFITKKKNGELNIYKEKKDSVPESKINKVDDFPESEMLLRCTNDLGNKKGQIKKYIESGIIKKEDPFIIALSLCDLDIYGSLLATPLKFLAGCGNMVLSKNRPPYFLKRQSIEKKESGSIVQVCVFEDPDFDSVSAVLYSSSSLLDAPPNPESTFQLFLNPRAEVPLPERFCVCIDTWHCEENEDGEEWKKTPATR